MWKEDDWETKENERKLIKEKEIIKYERMERRWLTDERDWKKMHKREAKG